MKIVCTGATGFLGSHIVREIFERGSAVFTLGSSQCDLRDWTETIAAFGAISPDLIIHAAGRVGGIGANREHPARFFYDNMLMGMNVIRAAKELGVKKTVMIGTTCSYPKFCSVPFRESDLWNGYPEETNAPYGIAKRALLTMAQAYRAEYGTNIVTVIPANLYGIGDHFEDETSHVIPALIKRFFSAKQSDDSSVTLWGDGTPTREFLYAEDAAKAIVLAAERYDGAEPINIGGTPEVSIREVAEIIKRIIGYEGGIVWDASNPNGQPRRQLDATRAKEWLGWEATTKLEDGLQRVLEWYRGVHVC